MSDFKLLVKTARQQKPLHFEVSHDHFDDVVKEPEHVDQQDPNYDAILEMERIREQNPRYLAEKERLRTIEMDKAGSPFQHPCQNGQNTITLVSENKEHEIDIEIDSRNNTALINFVRIDSSQRDSFTKLLTVVREYLREFSVEKIYQNIIVSDWETVISKHEEFKLVRIVNPVHDEGMMTFGFAIVEMAADDLVTGISKAMGMDITSHLDTSK